MLFLLKNPIFYTRWLPCVVSAKVLESSDYTGTMSLEIRPMIYFDNIPEFLMKGFSRVLSHRVVNIKWTIYDAVELSNKIYIRFEEITSLETMKIGTFLFVLDMQKKNIINANAEIGFFMNTKSFNSGWYYHDIKGICMTETVTGFIRNLLQYSAKFDYTNDSDYEKRQKMYKEDVVIQKFVNVSSM